ncbi:ParA family protein [Mesorhizobium sp. M2A.F.Ca.ET.043.05.1.1]|uniref:ParA family protein n=1 Tax=unclassified Mesorhizobium TaxID=325217 RepID=UPI000F74C153|nr:MULTISPECIES: ParA family protein [unclassified Mesorhizobium]AZO18889.1 ParA family protein [Mesorhizobium sp. M2A.F.Ca.ET.043.05.1.1]RUX18277.1 ParA family protein [Mesorhizobium sp. M2A.F.Ca.ET.042.01.1.1]
MSVYAVWNNKGGVGKSYLTFQIAAEYARTHPNEKVLVIDLCPQSNSSSMLLGGIIEGERHLDQIALTAAARRKTIAGYIEERILSPYMSPNVGASYVSKVRPFNETIPDNLYLVVGDEELEIQASRVANATTPGPADAWRIVHFWISDLIADIRRSWGVQDSTVFIDCNPSFTVYTELAMSASDNLIIPFSADGSSKRAVKAVLALLYGITRIAGAPQSQFFLESQRWRMSIPRIYSYVGNRLTQMNLGAAGAFKTVVNEIGAEIWNVWKSNPNLFAIHPAGTQIPSSQRDFRRMFQAEINDANTASVISGALGIPIMGLHAGTKNLAGRTITVNQSQLDRQKPNISDFVKTII